jgi:hypothetical protein
MTQRLSKLKPERLPPRGSSGRRHGLQRGGGRRVVVAWSPSLDESWIETISAARCTEVVLTARLGTDGSAKHRVFALAELLTQRLADTKSQVRVRFLPLTH